MLVILLAGNLTIGPMVSVPAGALLVLVWARLSGTPWRDLGFVRPKSWMLTVAVGIAAGIAFKLLMKMLIMPLLWPDPVNRTYHFLAGNRTLLPYAVWAMLVAGFGEETVFRGYLFERGARLLGRGRAAKAAVVLATALFFGIAHYADQGLPGVEQASIVGLVFGAIFSITGRIIPLMIAHAAFDLTALTLIYYDLEAKVGHLIFR
jgi:uncharacterized protein